MRIVHVNLERSMSPVDGIRAAVDAVAAIQRASGHEVALLDGAWRAERPALTAARDAAAFLRDASPDIVHFHSVFRPLHVAIAASCRSGGIPYVVSPHSGLAAGSLQRQRIAKLAWVALLDGPMLRRARGVICLTGVEREEVAVAVGRARTVVVPGMVTPAEPVDSAVLRDGRTIVTLSRFDVWQKGLDLLAATARLLPDATFHVYGTTDRNDPAGARALIATAPPNLTFHEPVHGVGKEHVLAHAAVYYQPSRWEGMSVSVLEALSRGLPCAVSPYIARSLGADGAGAVAEISDDPAVAAVELDALLRDEARLRRLSHAGPAWAADAADSAEVARLLEAAYRGAAAERVTP